MNDPVAAWLESLGLDRYRELFEQNAITWDVLPELNDGDLASMGIVLGHRKQLLRAMAQLSATGEGDTAATLAIPTAKDITPFPSSRDQAERRQLTIMFCDLVGSTALASQLDPEDLQTAIRRFLDTCSQAISRFNGYIAKYMGDGLLVYFGYPHAHEHDAERAVHAGLAVLEVVKSLPGGGSLPHQEFGIAARIGIATGHVIVGELIGQETARERSVFGETPNLAARLQTLAAPNQLVVDSATKRLIGSEFECTDHGTFSLKGFETPVQVWQVLGSKLSASRFESYRSGRLGNFIGREHETALLLGRWHEAVCGEGQVVILCGEAGIGKSRMVRSLRDRLAEEGYQTIQFQCSPYHTNTALYPVIRNLRQAAGLCGEDTPSIQLRKLDTLALNRGIDDRTTVSLLADLCSIRTDDLRPPPNVSSEKRKEMTLEALVQQLQRLAGLRPILIIVEDAHWLDPTTMDLLTRIIDRIQPMRVLLIITFRPDFKPVWVDYSHVTFLTLSRLPRRHSVELLGSLTGGKALPLEVEQAILAKTDGVPLYIEELTKNLLESGLLTEEKDSFTLKAPLRDLSIPDSLQALLMERIDRLGPAKEIVQMGASIGREFSYELLRETVDVAEGELKTALHALKASGLIFQEGDIPAAKYLFKHGLIQDAAYSTLPKKSRRFLHARIAKALESRFAERVKAEPELLAYHYEQAGVINSAVHYWHLAAHRDAARSADAEALSHFNRTLHLLETLPQSPERNALELDLLIARGAPLLTLRGYASDEIEHNYLRARTLSQENPGSERYVLSIWGLWVFHLVRGPLATACDLAEQLLSLAKRAQNPDLLIRAHESVGSTYSFLGRFDEAKTHLLAAKVLYDPDKHRSQVLPYAQDPGITARIMLARTLWILGEVDQVEALCQEAIAMARTLGHPFTLAFTLATVAWTYSTLRDTGNTLKFTEEAIALSTKYSFEVPLAWAISFQGWAMAEKGQEEGIGRLVNGLSATRVARASLNNTYTLALLADIYLRKKQIEEGLNAIKEAQDLALTQGERCWQAELFRLNGELLLAQSDQSIQAAEQCFAEAVKIAQEQHARMLELRAATSLARLLRKQNRSDTAKGILNATLSQFGAQDANPDCIEAQTILDQLNATS
ncbi:MAG: Proteins incorrectly called adenylate cyclase [Nitrospira sp.]|jgi:class 3 adenylate cyclase/predicted ATPase|nr:Proteins incorrectly called adenylate cyclase [Nitrospira sp.]